MLYEVITLFHHFGQEALSVSPLPAVHIRALVGNGREELMLQVSVASMDFDHVETGNHRQLAAVGELLLLLVNLGDRHLPCLLSDEELSGPLRSYNFV